MGRFLDAETAKAKLPAESVSAPPEGQSVRLGLQLVAVSAHRRFDRGDRQAFYAASATSDACNDWYNRVLEKGLREAGFKDGGVRQIMTATKAQQIAKGLTRGKVIPRRPKAF